MKFGEYIHDYVDIPNTMDNQANQVNTLLLSTSYIFIYFFYYLYTYQFIRIYHEILFIDCILYFSVYKYFYLFFIQTWYFFGDHDDNNDDDIRSLTNHEIIYDYCQQQQYQ